MWMTCCLVVLVAAADMAADARTRVQLIPRGGQREDTDSGGEAVGGMRKKESERRLRERARSATGDDQRQDQVRTGMPTQVTWLPSRRTSSVCVPGEVALAGLVCASTHAHRCRCWLVLSGRDLCPQALTHPPPANGATPRRGRGTTGTTGGQAIGQRESRTGISSALSRRSRSGKAASFQLTCDG